MFSPEVLRRLLRLTTRASRHVTQVGDNTELNTEVASALARKLKYTTFSTKALLEQTAKKSFAEIAEEESNDGAPLSTPWCGVIAHCQTDRL